MKIHKEGHKTIAYTVIILLIINLLLPYEPINFILYIPSFIVSVWVILFFRAPERKAAINDANILCPADGTIVAIKEVEENEYYNEKRMLISVFMSVTNVHINWYPVGGTIKHVKYHPGKHLVAFHPKSSLLNERTTIVIATNNNQSVLLRQIAGGIARRIVYHTKENEQVTQGNELGIIKFGSRVDLFLPLNARVQVKLNQKVRGNKTVIATF